MDASRFTMKITAMAVSLMIIMTGIASISIPAIADAIPLTSRAASENGMLRVRLDSLGKPGVYNLTTTGGYDAGGYTISSGSKVTVYANGGGFTMSVGGSSYNMGSSFWMARTGASSGVKIAQSSAPSNVYPGDIRFFYSGGTAYVVCRVYVEDYLLGVVSYEMSDSFPLNALKAQAITARTYAMKRLTSGSDWDVRDTTSDQVYKGTSSGANVKAAVESTCGMVLMYNNDYCSVYYSSSNGGQTETNGHAWGGSSLPYYRLQDDPYDLANPNSTLRKATIYSDFWQNAAAFQSLVTSKVGGVSRINSVDLAAPKYDSPSKLYTQLRLNVTLTNGSTASVTLDLFGGAASALGMSLSGLKNELFTIENASGGFRLMARRYGHGVGLSQYGAQQMAQTGYDYLSIMGFYFPGATLVRHTYTASLMRSNGTALAATDYSGAAQNSIGSVPIMMEPPQQTISPSAPQTLASLSAIVALDDSSSRLNLRKSPQSNAAILVKVPNGSAIQVQGTDSSGWLKATYGGKTGYIASQYVRIAGSGVTSLPNTAGAAASSTAIQTGQTGTNAAPANALGYVVTESGEGNAYLRAKASKSGTILDRVPHGSKVTVLSSDGAWTRVKYNGRTGYIKAEYVVY